MASSPEILCRVTSDRTVVNRPLAGTRKRGATQVEDLALEAELMADQKARLPSPTRHPRVSNRSTDKERMRSCVSAMEAGVLHFCR